MIYNYQIFPILPDWSNGISVKFGFETIISHSERFVEQRKPLRPLPVITQSFDTLFGDMRMIDYYLASMSLIFYVPFFPEGFTPITRGTGLTVIYTSNFMSNFFMRYMAFEVVVMSKTGNRDPVVLTLVGIGTNAISVEANSWVFDNDTIIFPAMRSTISNIRLGGIRAGLHSINFEFSTYTTGGETGLTLANDHEVFPGTVDWKTPPSLSTDVGRQIIQYDMGVIAIRTLTTTLGWNCVTNYFNIKSELLSLIYFFCSHRGRYKSFWSDTNHKYLTLASAIEIGASEFEVTRDSLQYVFSGIEWINIKLKSGTEIKKQLSARTGTNTYSVLTPFSQRIVPSDVDYISKYIYGRFDQDELEVQYQSNSLSDCSFKIHELVREYPTSSVS